MIEQKEIRQSITEAARELHADEAWLFGSYARNEANEDSDVDVFFIQKSELPRPKRTAQAYRVMRKWHVAKDIVVYTPEEFSRWKHVEGSLCYNVLHEGIRCV